MIQTFHFNSQRGVRNCTPTLKLNNMLSIINNNQLNFLDGRYYIDKETGEYYPSVTTILEAYPKPYALLQWMKDQGTKTDEIIKAAGRRGSNVHQLTEDYDNGFECNLLGENGQPRFSMEEWSMFERYVDFSTRFNPQHELIEQQVLSHQLGFAGTIDRVAIIDGKKYMIDIKTSNGIYNSYWLQLAAYRQALSLEAGVYCDGVAILWLNAKTRSNGKSGDVQGQGWQLVTKGDTSGEWALFQNVQKLWLAENANAKPKQFSYTISHKK